MAADLNEIAEELIEEFSLCEDADERTQLIIEIGDELDPMPEEAKLRENKIDGCVNQVWLVSQVVSGDGTKLTFQAASDGVISRGLITILLKLCSGRSPEEILAFDIIGFFEKLQIRITNQRSNGLRHMIRRIQSIAEANCK